MLTLFQRYINIFTHTLVKRLEGYKEHGPISLCRINLKVKWWNKLQTFIVTFLLI